MDYSPDELKEVMTREQLNWRSFAAKHGVAERWNSPPTPTYYVIDPIGRIRHKWTGNPGVTALDSILEKMIEEAERKE